MPEANGEKEQGFAILLHPQYVKKHLPSKCVRQGALVFLFTVLFAGGALMLGNISWPQFAGSVALGIPMAAGWGFMVWLFHKDAVLTVTKTEVRYVSGTACVELSLGRDGPLVIREVWKGAYWKIFAKEKPFRSRVLIPKAGFPELPEFLEKAFSALDMPGCLDRSELTHTDNIG